MQGTGDYDFLRELGRLYESAISKMDDADFILNEPQYQKLLDVVDFFKEIAEKCNGTIEITELSPRREAAWFSANFLVFDLNSEEVLRFCGILQYASAFGIDSTTTNEVCIAITIPNVFIRRQDLH